MKGIEIPFGAKDSELKGWEYTIPEGMEAEIKDGKIIVREKESEDERIRKWLYDYISNCPNNNFAFYGGVGKDAVLNYLEKQKEQKPAEWSEEDRRHLDRIQMVLESWDSSHTSLAGLPSTIPDDIDWLKSLRPVSKESLQPSWKPSEEQMDSLRDTIVQTKGRSYSMYLPELYEQLKSIH